MRAIQTALRHPQGLASLILLVIVWTTWFAYAPGLGGSLLLDDVANLEGLAEVRAGADAFQFVVTGASGPLGRPLALASFVPQAYAWPDSPRSFIRVNILIHLINGVLVTWFLLLLGFARRQSERQAALIAVAAGAAWMLMPLLASSSLLIIQRMTTLSALFVLAGAVAYLYARQAAARAPLFGLAAMSVALVAGTSMAILAKENGVLLPLLILAVEACLLRPPVGVPKRLWTVWSSIFLYAPLVVLLAYLATRLPYSEAQILRRDFNGLERVLSQAVALWQYLYLAFVPNVTSFGPFHDAFPIKRTLLNPVTFMAVVGWLAVTLAAFLLRRKVPLFTFAVTWFLLGHLLESTTVNLELYFEHRNYLPLIGPIYALMASMASVAQISGNMLRMAAVGITAYIFVLGGALFGVTSLWGSPALAAQMWSLYNPESTRAALHFATHLEFQGDFHSSRKLLRSMASHLPESDAIHVQIFSLSCYLEPDEDHNEEIRSLEIKLNRSAFRHEIVHSLEGLHNTVTAHKCADRQTVYGLAESLLKNPAFNIPVVRHNIHMLMARIGLENADFGLTMKHLEAALGIYPNPHTLEAAIDILRSGGRIDLAQDLIHDARSWDAPRNPLQAKAWEGHVKKLEDSLGSNKNSTRIDPLRSSHE